MMEHRDYIIRSLINNLSIILLIDVRSSTYDVAESVRIGEPPDNKRRKANWTQLIHKYTALTDLSCRIVTQMLLGCQHRGRCCPGVIGSGRLLPLFVTQRVDRVQTRRLYRR